MSDPKDQSKATKKIAKAQAKAVKKLNNAQATATSPPSSPVAANPLSPAERSAQAAEAQVRLQKRRVWIALIGSLIGLITLIATLT
jgi:hypothetical protein